MGEPLAREARGDRPASCWLLAVSLVALAAVAAGALHHLGRAARVMGRADTAGAAGSEVLLVRTNGAAVQAWRARRLRGRTLVHVGRFLHFVDDDAPVISENLTGPGRGRAVDDALVQRAGARNYLWIAASTGMLRRILYLPPPASLEERLSALGLDRGALPVAVPFETFPRAFLDELPRLEEPVLLDVNASFFEQGSAAALQAALRASGLRTDLVTLSLAEDASDVSDGARGALRAFGAVLAGHGLEVAP